LFVFSVATGRHDATRLIAHSRDRWSSFASVAAPLPRAPWWPAKRVHVLFLFYLFCFCFFVFPPTPPLSCPPRWT
jgi:hypothetical protein